jgi:hypothetical protein
MMTMTAKETAAKIRATLKDQGIRARVRIAPGSKTEVQVYAIAHGVEFSEDHQRAIRTLGVSMGLTWVRGLPIVIEQMTNPFNFNFYLP